MYTYTISVTIGGDGTTDSILVKLPDAYARDGTPVAIIPGPNHAGQYVY